MRMQDVTDEQILRIARLVLGNVQMTVERTPNFVLLVVAEPQRTWIVRPSRISDDYLAFDPL